MPFYARICSTGLLSFQWNSIRLGGHVHGTVTKTVHKTLPGDGRGQGIGVGGWMWWDLGGDGV